MENFSKAEILQMVEEEDVEFIRLQFADMFGVLKNIAIPSSRLWKALDNQCIIDASSVEGVLRSREMDLFLHPDLSTFTILPWRPQQGKVARFLCDLYTEEGELYEESPRRILQKAVERAKQMGYTLQVNPECEFFLFHTDDNGMPTTLTHEQAGYLDTSPVDLGENARRDIVLTLEEMGYEVESSHHEIAPAQHEIDFNFDGPLETADKLVTFRVAVRTIAKRYGLHATFMPKPRAGVNGSGMHLKMRLMKDGKDVFTCGQEKGQLSREGNAFLAGILDHIQGMTAVLNPLVNSYKRLSPGFEAPSDITWSFSQRTALMKAVKYEGSRMQLELRSPDAAANPYLVFALCLEAGLDGIQRGLQAPPQLTENLRKLSAEEKEEKGIRSLPGNLGEALGLMEKEELVKHTLGETFARRYIRYKKEEWNSYMEQISEWELKRYLYRV